MEKFFKPKKAVCAQMIALVGGAGIALGAIAAALAIKIKRKPDKEVPAAE